MELYKARSEARAALTQSGAACPRRPAPQQLHSRSTDCKVRVLGPGAGASPRCLQPHCARQWEARVAQGRGTSTQAISTGLLTACGATRVSLQLKLRLTLSYISLQTLWTQPHPPRPSKPCRPSPPVIHSLPPPRTATPPYLCTWLRLHFVNLMHVTPPPPRGPHHSLRVGEHDVGHVADGRHSALDVQHHGGRQPGWGLQGCVGVGWGDSAAKPGKPVPLTPYDRHPANPTPGTPPHITPTATLPAPSSATATLPHCTHAACRVLAFLAAGSDAWPLEPLAAAAAASAKLGGGGRR